MSEAGDRTPPTPPELSREKLDALIRRLQERKAQRGRPEARPGASEDLEDLEAPEVAGVPAAAAPDPAAGRIPRRPDAGPAPLSFAQERLWFLQELEPGGAAYNIPACLLLAGDLDRAALARALAAIVRRHEALRTVFVRQSGRPVQVVRPAGPVPMPLIDLAALPAAAARAALVAAAAAEAAAPFDLAAGPPLRVRLVRLPAGPGPAEHGLLLTLHHIAADGWSLGVLVAELAALYGGGALPDLAIQYADYAVWQRTELTGEALDRLLGWWLETLAGAPPVMELPTDRPRPPVQSGRGGLAPVALPPALVRGLAESGRQQGATLFMTLLAGWQALLLRLTGRADLVVGTPAANRSRPETEALIGFLINTLPLRTDLAGNPSWREALTRVRQTVTGAWAHQDLPFERLVGALAPQRSLSHSPLVQVLIAVQTGAPPPLALPGLAVSRLEVERATAKLDLSLELEEQAGADGMGGVGSGMAGWLEVNLDLFDRATAVRWAGHFTTLLAAAAAEPARPLAELPLLAAAEERQVLAWSLGAADSAGSFVGVELASARAETSSAPAPELAPLPDGREDAVRAAGALGLAAAFAARAAAAPQAIALETLAGLESPETAAEPWTYGRLEAAANRLARWLAGRGVGPWTRVGLGLDRCPELIVAALAVIKAGGAYVPLDPAQPAARLARMAADGELALLLTVERLAEIFPEQGSEQGPEQGPTLPRLVLDGPEGEAVARLSAAPFASPAGPDDLLYVIFTSGSTGQPKGAGVTRGAFDRLLAWYGGEFGFGADDRVLVLSSPSFDLTQKTLFAPLLAGGRLLLGPEPYDPRLLAGAVERRGATRINCTPSAFHPLLDAVDGDFGRLAALRTVFLGGEPIAAARLAPWRGHAACRAEVVNTYGPTECTDVVAFHRLPSAAEEAPVPVGRPLPGLRLLVIDRLYGPATGVLPLGVPGQLAVAGAAVGAGYLRDAALTAARFRPDPTAPDPGARLYLTGDLARWRPAADLPDLPGGPAGLPVLEYLGRIDQQVKVRGFRVELGEVEAALAAGAGVREAAAAVHGERLIGFAAGEGLDADALRDGLRERLPDFMVPALVVVLPALPLTPNGKLDRQALGRLAGEAAAGRPRAAAALLLAPDVPHLPPASADELTERLAALFGEVLGLPAGDRVGPAESFFDLGGHSLLATQLQSRIRDAFGHDLPLRRFFEAPTPAGLAGVLREAAALPTAVMPVPTRDLRAERRRARLAERAAARRGAAPEPAGAVEARLGEMFAEVLGWDMGSPPAPIAAIPAIAPTESFFDLGGHSLLAAQLQARIRRAFGLELPLQRLFEAPTPAGLAGLLRAAAADAGFELLADADALLMDDDVPEPAGDGTAPALSFAQERMWFLDRFDPGSPVYNISLAVHARGVLAPAVLAAAFGLVAGRHEPLRARFPAAGGRALFVLAPPAPPPLPVVDLAGLPAARRQAAADELGAAELARPFDLAAGPLLRTTLVRLAAEEHLLLATVHHIAADGWSVGVLLRELAAGYGALAAGLPPALPTPPVSYSDFARWQRAELAAGALAAQATYWCERLAGLPVLHLPTDRPRPPRRAQRGSSVAAVVPAATLAALAAVARREGATLFMALLAGFQAVLGRWSGQRDFAVGTPVANRTRVWSEGLIGLFINTLALRSDLSAGLAGSDGNTGAAVLARVRRTCLEAFDHQDLPFERLIEELAPERDPSFTPVVQVLLTLQNAPLGTLALPGLTLTPVFLPSPGARLDLTLSVEERDGRLAGMLEYDRDLFDRATAERLTGHLATLLAAFAADPGRRLAELPLLTAAEAGEVLAWSRGAALDGDREALRAPGTEGMNGGGLAAGAWPLVLDPDLGLLPPGVPGQLAVAGVPAGAGYAGDPALTAERFVPDPLGGEPGGRLYLSGELARWRPGAAGEPVLEYLGRPDRQAAARARLADLAAAGADGPVAARLAALFGEVLELPPATRVGTAESFFELGGHSLLATQLQSRVRDVFGVDLPLRSFFQAPTPASLARLVNEARADGGTAAAPAGADAAEPAAAPVPSFAQERMWFLDRLDPGSPVYNIALAVQAAGALDPAALAAAFAAVAGRHEPLRSRFPEGEGGMALEVAPRFLPAMPLVDLAALPAARRATEAEALGRQELARPFDLAAGPLLRTTVLRLDAELHLLLSTVHHIAADGWSVGLLMRELALAYGAAARGERPALPPLPASYSDFARWQRGQLAGGLLTGQAGYWRERLAGLPVLRLPTDRPRPPRRAQRGSSLEIAWPAAAAAPVAALARSSGATLFMALLAGLQAVLGRWSGQRDFAVGTPVANRTQTWTEGLIGLFVNTLALRSDLGGGAEESSGGALLGRVRQTCLTAYENQDLPFERLIEELAPERDPSFTPLVQVMLTLQNVPLAPLALPGLTLAPVFVPSPGARFDLALSLEEREDGIVGMVEYDCDLFDGATAERLTGHLATLLGALAADPGQPIDELPLLTAAERAQLAGWEEAGEALAPASDSRALSLAGAFAAQVAAVPGALAVEAGERRWTYGELGARVDRLAGHLAAAGVGPWTRVGLGLDRCPEFVLAALAVERAGGAYVPLDPAQPAARLGRMAADARLALVLTVERLAPRLPDVQGAQRIVLDGADREAIERAAPLAAASAGGPDDLLYVIYTSGSTGQPKGAGVTRRGFANLLAWYTEAFGFGPADRVLCWSAVAFDLTQKTLFAPLVTGGRLLLGGEPYDPEALAATIASRGVTRVNCTPSAFYPLLGDDRAEALARLAPLRSVFLGGEPIAAARLAAWRRHPACRAEVLNTYGPTECSDVVAWHRLEPPPRPATGPEANPAPRPDQAAGGDDRPVPLGRPVPGARLLVLDPALGALPVGVPGQLAVAGTPVGAGYLGDPALTADRFRPAAGARLDANLIGADLDVGAELASARVEASSTPTKEPKSAPMPGARLYLTGDLARRRPDGLLDYLGRVDHQVKVRGFRIELGEIEAALAGCPGVREAAVVVREAAAGARLVAYVVAGGEAGAGLGAGLDLAAVRAHLAGALPDFMVPSPSSFVALDALPLSANGKVDRRALPAPRDDRDAAAPLAPLAAPRGDLEELLCGLFADVLGVERVGTADSFFDLGGHSLLATRLVARIRQACGVEVPLRRLFELTTVAALAPALASLLAHGSGADGAAPPPLGPCSGEAIAAGELPLSYSQERLWILDRFEPGSAAYNIPAAVRFRGRLDAGALARSLAEVVRRHGALRTGFRSRDGRPVQVVEPEVAFGLGVADLSRLAPGRREEELARLAAADAAAPFDLTRPPLLRAALLCLAGEPAAGDWVLLLCLHHIAGDGWSLGVLVAELTRLYEAAVRGAAADLPPLAIQYADFAVWQRRRPRPRRARRPARLLARPARRPAARPRAAGRPAAAGGAVLPRRPQHPAPRRRPRRPAAAGWRAAPRRRRSWSCSPASRRCSAAWRGRRT